MMNRPISRRSATSAVIVAKCRGLYYDVRRYCEWLFTRASAVSYDSTIGWMVGNSDTTWADRYRKGDKLPEMAWLLIDLFGRTNDEVVKDVVKARRLNGFGSPYSSVLT
jgi:hypothetical protein